MDYWNVTPFRFVNPSQNVFSLQFFLYSTNENIIPLEVRISNNPPPPLQHFPGYAAVVVRVNPYGQAWCASSHQRNECRRVDLFLTLTWCEKLKIKVILSRLNTRKKIKIQYQFSFVFRS